MKKRALEVADRLERSIERAGWPVGSSLGDESTLMAEYEVGRSVLRQAIRIVEHLGIATSRRGRHGGLVVTRPGPEPAALTLRIGWSKDRVVARSTEQLRDIVGTWALRAPPGADIIHRVVSTAHDVFAANLVLGHHPRPRKSGERIAVEMISELAARNWVTDGLLGSENDLMEKYDAGRAALREAVHLLELHDVAVMQRGPGGGLLVLDASSSGALPPSLRAQLHAEHLDDSSITTLIESLLEVLPSDQSLPPVRPLRLATDVLLGSS